MDHVAEQTGTGDVSVIRIKVTAESVKSDETLQRKERTKEVQGENCGKTLYLEDRRKEGDE